MPRFPVPRNALPLTALLHGLPPAYASPTAGIASVVAPVVVPGVAPIVAPIVAPVVAPVVALVGAGGKTTLLFALARALAACGLKVITATTTHIFPPTPAQSPLCLLSPTLPEVQNALQRHNHVTVTGKAVITKTGQRKLSGLSFDFVENLRTVGDMLLVEADGAAMRPLKAPASHEPAVPPCTTLCIALCGLRGLGLPLHDVVHRPERAAALCGLPDNLSTEPALPAHLAHLALHPQGLFRTAPPNALRAVLCTIPTDLPVGIPAGMPAATGQALARQAVEAAQKFYPHHPATWWVGSALHGWVEKL